MGNENLLMIMMLMLGMYSHYLKALIQKKKDGTPMGFRQYWVENPYQTQLSIIVSIITYIALMQAGELTFVTAWGAGFVCNSAADVIGSRALKS